MAEVCSYILGLLISCACHWNITDEIIHQKNEEKREAHRKNQFMTDERKNKPTKFEEYTQTEVDDVPYPFSNALFTTQDVNG